MKNLFATVVVVFIVIICNENNNVLARINNNNNNNNNRVGRRLQWWSWWGGQPQQPPQYVEPQQQQQQEQQPQYNQQESRSNCQSTDNKWYAVDYNQGQTPKNVCDLGNNQFIMKVAPYEESVKLHSHQFYSGGRFEILLRTASSIPGVITAFFLASSDEVQRSDYDMGTQDEIDFEFIGTDLTNAHTNIFINGQQQAETIAIGNDHSKSKNKYAIEWDNESVRFFINDNMVRNVYLNGQPLKPMRLSMTVWTTSGGWQGLKEWAGDSPDWDARGQQPLEAEFDVLYFPN